MSGADPLRVLIADERIEQLRLLVGMVEGLGHDAVAGTVSLHEVAATTARERPDVAIVGLGDGAEHALDLVSEIVREASCPVIAVLTAYDADCVREAATRGVFAYIVAPHPSELQSAIDIVLLRFAELQVLRGAIARGSAEADQELAAANGLRRQALELHDGVVQGLVTAQLAHDVGRFEDSRAALVATLERAKAIVSRDLAELESQGHSTRQLIEDAAAGSSGG